VQVINWHQTLHVPADAHLSADTEDLILRLCCGASQRLGRSPRGAAELRSHAFFAGVEFDALRRMRAPHVPRLRYATDTSNFDTAATSGGVMTEHWATTCERGHAPHSQPSPAPPTGSSSTAPSGTEPATTRHQHAFLEFTFRRFFDADGHAHATPLTDGPAPIYV